MIKVIAAINMTLDGYCDHTAIDPDDEIHQHYADLLHSADTILYGRITYELMTYWQSIINNPTGNKATDAFALIMDKVPKLVFSHTMTDVDWESASLAHRTLAEEIEALKQSQHTKDKAIFVGSRSLIIQLLNQQLIDEFQLCIHPVIAGSGLPLFENIKDRIQFKLIKTKTFISGAVILYYEPTKEERIG